MRRKARQSSICTAAFILLVAVLGDISQTVNAFGQPRPTLTARHRRTRPLLPTSSVISRPSYSASSSLRLSPADFAPHDLGALWTSSCDALAASSSLLDAVLRDSTVTATADLATSMWLSSKGALAGTSANLHNTYGWVLDDPHVAAALGAASSAWVASKEAAAETSANLLAAYGQLLREHPLTTKSITAGILACSGDAIAQSRSQADKYDAKRGAAFLAFGAGYTGAFQHLWFTYMSEHISTWGALLGVWGPERASLPVETIVNTEEWWSYFDVVAQFENPPSETALAVGKLIINQFGMVPLVYMPLFFALTGALGNLDFTSSVARARSLYFQILRRNYFFWLPVQFMQFLIIPSEWQIPFLSTASLIWTVILSTIGGNASEKTAQIVAYVEEKQGDEEIVTVMQVLPGAANEITDDVSLRDLENALIPERLLESVRGVLSDGKVGAVSGGFALGLLASAADDGLIGAAVGSFVQGEPSLGVTVVTAVSAGVGLLASANQAAGQNATAVSELNDELQIVKPLTDEDNEEVVQHTVNNAVEVGLGMLVVGTAAAQNLSTTKNQAEEERDEFHLEHPFNFTETRGTISSDVNDINSDLDTTDISAIREESIVEK